MEIVFVRHGQTDLNKTGRMQGSLFDQSLSMSGRKFAEKVAANFDPSSFELVFASPMKRAVETAELFTKNTKKLNLDKRLIEFNFGEWDGQLLTVLGQKYPDAVDPWGKAAKNYVKYAPSGETFAALESRCEQFLTEMVTKHKNQKLLVVCHGTLIRMMFAHCFASGDMNCFDTIDNCALAKISYRAGVWRLNYYNRRLVV
ncbi:histidine phosphatase family protein [Lactobacillus sp. ESL0684]|uniref:histidine phosphatase family protein n=1 Tax=unclassified Lactobacillus TaxID=2620435 RepID=UPI0023F84524|nr:MULTISPECIES: histidine phosphatase family protein [unclassified Lactobacillus]WEV40008.1 histidine phosphatase family protein [Lactobacillus sp. ESL0681]WEV43452.1 histidine phosphatase family protein [Lactobacillus sp. ESL0684]